MSPCSVEMGVTSDEHSEESSGGKSESSNRQAPSTWGSIAVEQLVVSGAQSSDLAVGR